MLFRPCLSAATMVVAVPQKGSSTVSPVNENICTRREAVSLDVAHLPLGVIVAFERPVGR